MPRPVRPGIRGQLGPATRRADVGIISARLVRSRHDMATMLAQAAPSLPTEQRRERSGSGPSAPGRRSTGVRRPARSIRPMARIVATTLTVPIPTAASIGPKVPKPVIVRQTMIEVIEPANPGPTVPKANSKAVANSTGLSRSAESKHPHTGNRQTHHLSAPSFNHDRPPSKPGCISRSASRSTR